MYCSVRLLICVGCAVRTISTSCFRTESKTSSADKPLAISRPKTSSQDLERTPPVFVFRTL